MIRAFKAVSYLSVDHCTSKRDMLRSYSLDDSRHGRERWTEMPKLRMQRG